jgi:hypothetical protein
MDHTLCIYLCTLSLYVRTHKNLQNYALILYIEHLLSLIKVGILVSQPRCHSVRCSKGSYVLEEKKSFGCYQYCYIPPKVYILHYILCDACLSFIRATQKKLRFDFLQASAGCICVLQQHEFFQQRSNCFLVIVRVLRLLLC